VKWIIEPLAIVVFFAVALLLGPIGIAIAMLWIIAGITFVMLSRSRGILADVLYVFSWPLWMIWES
jgi:hypothetical protein